MNETEQFYFTYEKIRTTRCGFYLGRGQRWPQKYAVNRLGSIPSWTRNSFLLLVIYNSNRFLKSSFKVSEPFMMDETMHV